MTNGEKFKEVFGRDLEESRMLSMPSSFNQIIALKSFQIEGVDCADEWKESEYQGEPTKTDLISKEEALELFPLILSGELLSIGTVREQLRKLQTVEAVPLSVIEKIKAEIDKHKLPCCFKDDRGYTHFLPNVIKVDDVLEIIDHKIKEIKHDR